MKKLWIISLLALLLTISACSGPVDVPLVNDESGMYKTRLSPENQLTIVRTPAPADYSMIHPGKMTSLPSYDPDSGQMWQVDLRSSDLTSLDLSGRTDDLLHADFDSKTQWPEVLPDGFDPELIMSLGKNPGLGLKKLHESGVTGKGIGLAIIDQGLLVDHLEYKDQLKLYEEIHCGDQSASMHGPAVASIAVGDTVGVAPDADLYFIAETHGTNEGTREFKWDLTWLAKSIDRIVTINKTLPKDSKIRVISISLGIGSSMNGYEKALSSIEKAKKEGIYTVYVGSDPYMGIGRNPLKDPDVISSYTKGEFWKHQKVRKTEILIPMDSRCTASPTGTSDYVFYREGGMSWSVPYVAGLYALACQVKPDITPDAFWKAAFETSETLYTDNSNTESIGLIINPEALIESLR